MARLYQERQNPDAYRHVICRLNIGNVVDAFLHVSMRLLHVVLRYESTYAGQNLTA